MYGDLWLKRVLIPLWVIQLIFTILVLLSASVGLGVWQENADDFSEEYDNTEDVEKAIKIGAGVYIAVSSVTILFNIVEIVLFARKRLNPIVAVVLNSITTLIWVVIVILAIVALVQSGVSVLGFIFFLVITATCKGKLLYASMVLHRYRKAVRDRGAYTPAQVEAGTFDTTHTAYNPAGPPPNPFRDPSPAPPQNQVAGSAYSTPGGYGVQYEMQQQSGGRYA